jgi:hypothetical protein
LLTAELGGLNGIADIACARASCQRSVYICDIADIKNV